VRVLNRQLLRVFLSGSVCVVMVEIIYLFGVVRLSFVLGFNFFWWAVNMLVLYSLMLLVKFYVGSLVYVVAI